MTHSLQLLPLGTAAPAKASASGMLPLAWIAAGFSACAAIFIWAAGKGLSFGDEAFYVLTLADPFSRIDVSDSGYLLHPLYVLLHANIASLRVAGAVMMGASALLFCRALLRFIGPVTTIERLCVTLALCACVVWQYKDGIRVPNYNTLNLCALLVFFTGLLRASTMPVGLQRGLVRETFGPSLLCAIGLTVMALTKQTSAVAAVVLGLCWIALLRPNRADALAVLTSALGLMLLLTAVFGIYHSLSAFIDAKILGLEELHSADTTGDVHGIAQSFVKSVSGKPWKILEYAESVAGFVVFAFAWSWLLTRKKQSRAATATAYIIAVSFALIMAWWRAEDFIAPSDAFGGWRFGAWNFEILSLLGAAVVCILCIRTQNLRIDERRAAIAAALIGVAPFVYSFGTSSAITFHAATASIFWAAAVITLAGAATAEARANFRIAAAFVCAATATGLVVGMAASPYRNSPPLWNDNEPVDFGATGSRLLLERPAADFVRGAQRLVRMNGFQQGMPIAVFSAGASGTVLAFGGSPIASTASLSYVGEESHARFAFEHTSAAELRQAWVITDGVGSLADAQRLFAERGIDFPTGYEAVAHMKRTDVGWDEVFWKPRKIMPAVVHDPGLPLHRHPLHFLMSEAPF
ncbi:MAG TPA: hypothetical protein VFW28_15100 [Micropepsaceae bacterium]|nr:hypothetical protein [Micropepsaceae bacterium]